MSFLLLNNCPSIPLRAAIKDSRRLISIPSVVVVNPGMLWSGLLVPINVSTAWTGITVIVAARGVSTVCQMSIDGLVIA